MPQVVVLAGPNGAGKTTASRAVLSQTYQVPTYVNPDIIAQGLSGFAPEAAAFEASAIMLRRLRAMWLVFDNSDPAGQQLLACGECDTVKQVFDAQTWSVFAKGPTP